MSTSLSTSISFITTPMAYACLQYQCPALSFKCPLPILVVLSFALSPPSSVVPLLLVLYRSFAEIAPYFPATKVPVNLQYYLQAFPIQTQFKLHPLTRALPYHTQQTSLYMPPSLVANPDPHMPPIVWESRLSPQYLNERCVDMKVGTPGGICNSTANLDCQNCKKS